MKFTHLLLVAPSKSTQVNHGQQSTHTLEFTTLVEFCDEFSQDSDADSDDCATPSDAIYHNVFNDPSLGAPRG